MAMEVGEEGRFEMSREVGLVALGDSLDSARTSPDLTWLCHSLFPAWLSVTPGKLLLEFTEDTILYKPQPAGPRFLMQLRTVRQQEFRREDRESPEGGCRGASPAPVGSRGIRGASGRRGAGSRREAHPPFQVTVGGEAGRAAKSLGVKLCASSRGGELSPAPRKLSWLPPSLENSPRNICRESCEILSIFIARVGQRGAGCQGGLLAGSRFVGLGKGQRAGLLLPPTRPRGQGVLQPAGFGALMSVSDRYRSL